MLVRCHKEHSEVYPCVNDIKPEALVVKSARYAFVVVYGVEPWMGIVASWYELCTNRYCCLRFSISVTPHITQQYKCFKKRFACFDQESCISPLWEHDRSHGWIHYVHLFSNLFVYLFFEHHHISYVLLQPSYLIQHIKLFESFLCEKFRVVELWHE